MLNMDPLKCEFCEKQFSAKSAHDLHVKTAAYCLKLRGELPPDIPCEYCGKKFAQRGNLRMHLKTCRSKIKKVEEETLDELQNLKNKEKSWKRTTIKNKATISNLEKIVIEKNREISILKQSKGLDKIISSRDDEISGLRNLLTQYEQDEKNHLKRIFKLEKQLAFEKGRLTEASKPKIIAKNYKCNSTKNKLMSIPINNIRPFTVETIRDSLVNYTYEDYIKGPRGLINFIKSIILQPNENGELERNYVCTDPSRNNYYRLEETREWDNDRGASYLEVLIDEMGPFASECFDQLCFKATDRTNIFDRESNANLLEKLKPFHFGISRPVSEERDALLTTIRTGIKSSASL